MCVPLCVCPVCVPCVCAPVCTLCVPLCVYPVCVPCVCVLCVCISLSSCGHLGLLRAFLSGCCFMVYMEEPEIGGKQGLKSLSLRLSSAVEVHAEPESPSQCPGYAPWLPVLSGSYRICLRSLDDATGSHNCSGHGVAESLKSQFRAHLFPGVIYYSRPNNGSNVDDFIFLHLNRKEEKRRRKRRH